MLESRNRGPEINNFPGWDVIEILVNQEVLHNEEFTARNT